MREKFALGHVYDVTEFHEKIYTSGYAKYYICSDVWDFHVYRVLVGINSEGEEEPRTKIVEENLISKSQVRAQLSENLDMFLEFEDIRNFPGYLFENRYKFLATDMTADDWFKAIIECVIDEDCGDCYDTTEFRYDTAMEVIIDEIDGGYGITVLDENLKEKVSE